MQTKLSGFSRCNEVVVAEVLSYPLHTGLPEREYRTRKKNPETAATPLHLVYASYGPINAEKAMWY
jgi:hypothetical protein